MAATLTDCFNLKKKGIICIIGAGGKTSLMFELAKELSQSGRILTTTTTKIFRPDISQSPVTIIENDMNRIVKQAGKSLQSVSSLTIAPSYHPGMKKLIGFPPETVEQIWRENLFDWIIVEADGAKQKPIKSSNDREPVFVGTCAYLILAAGLETVGSSLDEDNVHRSDIFSKITGREIGEKIDEASFAAALIREIKKAAPFCRPAAKSVFLNKQDQLKQGVSFQKIISGLRHEPLIERIISGSLINGPQTEILFPREMIHGRVS